MDDISQIQRELLSSPAPMLFGPEEVVDGWCSLENIQRSNALRTLGTYPDEVALWERALKLLVDGFPGVWGTIHQSIESPATITRIHLLALEVSSAKAALDMILAGYYSIAFASIRHMLEATAQSMYLHLFPEKHIDWDPEANSPTMRKMINQIKSQLRQNNVNESSVERFESLYESWRLMSKGSHPTGTGLIQVIAQGDEPINAVGSSYRPDFVDAAFDHGLFALLLLLIAFPELRTMEEEWLSRFKSWIDDRQTIRQRMRKRRELEPDLGNGAVTSKHLET